MAKLNWNPWMGLADMKAEVERVMSEAARRGRAPSGVSEKAYFWAPAADVLETADAYVITVELPGVEREDVAVEVKTRTLWVYGERRFAKGCEGEAEAVYHSLERSYGPFARRFVLPKGVDRSSVGAVFKNGLLEISLPKECHEARCRRIQIL
ncbi:Hsp20/alpha crystallin family protein [Fundidesulfovibrio putealis]|jgi:HSP20 family protein|uniref:Hsp20/alpha crystallin family protein n=1 Tax=Fundidesulfovibrio putealis TaxID=270496 RepID=UPI0004295797|nr:Hsp20/alpha crystallin family protein [Fundidesulfovibrio putealis]